MSDELSAAVGRLRKERNAVILAHNYQVPEIQDVADFVGDSLELARTAADLSGYRTIVFCGVRFMAETAKILAPDRTVVIPDPDAGCTLADAISPDDVAALRRKYPDAAVVSYVNTNADVKAVTDVCCTSSNAAAVVRAVPARRVIFVPDRNLLWHVARLVPEKELIPWNGACCVHEQFTIRDEAEARLRYPDAEILVHPECRPEVQARADAVLSTSGMLRRARESSARRFIVGTEEGLLHRLKRENPGKLFHSLGNARICATMKRITLAGLAAALETGRHEIVLDPALMDRARGALERMLA